MSGLTAEELAELDSLLLQEPPSFADFAQSTLSFPLHSWQREHLCPVLERCVTERGLRIAIHGPPQYGKSILVSQRLPAYLIGCDPEHRVGLAAYNETRATGFGDIVKHLVQSEDFQRSFPGVALDRLDPKMGEFSTLQRAAVLDGQPSFVALGLQSGFVGRGVDTLIIDDPYKTADEARSEIINEKVWRFWNETAKVRLATEANVIVMFHRYHDDDFAGRLLAEGGWEYLRFPVEADGNEDGSDPTGRLPGELLSPLRPQPWVDAIREADPMTFAGQFQGKPRPDEGSLIKSDWLQIVPQQDVPRIETLVRYWDLAVSEKETADYTAGALVGFDSDGTMYVLDVIRFREQWPRASEIIARVSEEEYTGRKEWQTYHVGIDARATQLGLVQDLFTKGMFQTVPLWPDKTRGDKVQRASGWAARASAGKARLLRGNWNGKFVDEACAFPLGRHDDMVDAVSGAYELLWRLRGGAKNEQVKPEHGSLAYYDQVARNAQRQSRSRYARR